MPGSSGGEQPCAAPALSQGVCLRRALGSRHLPARQSGHILRWPRGWGPEAGEGPQEGDLGDRQRFCGKRTEAVCSPSRQRPGLTYLESAVQSRLPLLLLTGHSLLASELRKVVLHFLKNASPVVFSAPQPAFPPPAWSPPPPEWPGLEVAGSLATY